MSSSSAVPKEMVEWLLVVITARTPVAGVQLGAFVLAWLSVLYYSYDAVANLQWLSVVGLVVILYYGSGLLMLSASALPWAQVKHATIGSSPLRPVKVEITPDNFYHVSTALSSYISFLTSEIEKQRRANPTRFGAMAVAAGAALAVVGVVFSGFWLLVTLTLVVVALPLLYAQGFLAPMLQFVGMSSSSSSASKPASAAEKKSD